MTIGPNPNKVKKEHFARAIELAAMSPSEDDRPHPKVGAVVVKDGEIIAEAYRGQIGQGDHAEFIALERKSRGNPNIEGSDLITTLEPCTQRSHDKKPCVSWIRTRRIRKVWIGTLDYNPIIMGKGETYLRNNSILIGRFPDDLQLKILEQNAEFFNYISSLQPSLSSEELENRVETMRDIIKTELVESNRSEYLSEDSLRSWDFIVNAYNRNLMMDADDSERWNEIGWYLYNAGLYGPAGFAFDTCTKIDVSFFDAWLGLGASEIKIYNNGAKKLTYPLKKTLKNLETAYKLNSEPNKLHCSAWTALFDSWNKVGNEKIAKICATRAVALDPSKEKKK